MQRNSASGSLATSPEVREAARDCLHWLIAAPLIGNHGLWAALMVLNGTCTFTLWRLDPKVLALTARG